MLRLDANHNPKFIYRGKHFKEIPNFLQAGNSLTDPHLPQVLPGWEMPAFPDKLFLHALALKATFLRGLGIV